MIKYAQMKAKKSDKCYLIFGICKKMKRGVEICELNVIK